MNKTRNNELVKLADEALNNTNRILFKEPTGNGIDIFDAYNGQIAALSVTIAMSGLRPALAIYYQDAKTKVKRRNILTIIAKMIQTDIHRDLENANDNNFRDERSLFQYALATTDNGLKKLTKEVEECAIALKQVVRTYNLVKS